MDPTSIMSGTLVVANQALALLATLGAVTLLLSSALLRNQWRELSRGPRWGDPWTDFEAEEPAGSLTSERRAA
jgi:hypothetical protein